MLKATELHCDVFIFDLKLTLLTALVLSLLNFEHVSEKTAYFSLIIISS